MGRLTERIEKGCYASLIQNDYQVKEQGYETLEEDTAEAIDKLGQLEDIEEELDVDLITLFKALKSKQCGLRYFDKADAFANKCEVGWYVQMLMYGWLPFKDFIKSLTKEELESV